MSICDVKLIQNQRIDKCACVIYTWYASHNWLLVSDLIITRSNDKRIISENLDEIEKFWFEDYNLRDFKSFRRYMSHVGDVNFEEINEAKVVIAGMDLYLSKRRWTRISQEGLQVCCTF